MAERRRKTKELLDLLQRQRIAGIARGVTGQPPPTEITPSVTPYIKPEQRAKFEEQQAQQRIAKIPFGGEIPVGHEEGAREQRRKPELGSWWGSGVAENLAQGALPVLENLQKGIETFGGVATGSTLGLIPGEQTFERHRREIGAEQVKKGRQTGFWDWAGKLQGDAEAFRRTDMPSMTMDIIPGTINLPGDKTLDEVDIGVKGLIELLPEILVGVATAGTGTGGSLAKRAGISVSNALGADVAKGIIKVGKKVALKPAELQSISDAVRHLPSIRMDLTYADDYTKLKSIANALPSYARKPFISMWTKINPAQILDASRASVRLPLAYLKATALIDGGTQAALAGFYRRATKLDPENEQRLSMLPKTLSDDEVTELNRRYEAGLRGDELHRDILDTRGTRGTEGKEPNWLSRLPTRLGREKSLFGIAKSGNIVGVVDEKTGDFVKSINGKHWTEVFENFLDPSGKKARTSKTARHNYRSDSDIGKAIYEDEAGIATTDMYKRDANGKIMIDDKGKKMTRHFLKYEGGNTSEFATFLRHYGETMQATKLHFESVGGKVLTTKKLDFLTAWYTPRNINGGSIYDEIRHSWPGYGSPPGRTPRPLQQRSLTNEELAQRIEDGTITLAGPMETLETHIFQMYKAGIDLELKKNLRVAAEAGDGGVFNFNKAKRQAKYAITKMSKGEGSSIQESTLKNLDEIGFGSIAEVIRRWRGHEKAQELTTSSVGMIRPRRIKNVQATIKDSLDKAFDEDVTEINNLYHKPVTPAGAKVPAYLGMLFETEEDMNRIIKAHKLNEPGRVEASFKVLGEVGDVMRVARTGADAGFWLIQGLPTLGLAASRLATGNFKEGSAMVKAWAKSAKVGFQAFYDPDRISKTLMDNLDILEEAIGNGLQLSRGATDVFQAIQRGEGGRGGILSRIPKVGETIDDYFKTVAAPFERAFVAPGDLLRIEYYRAMRDTAGKNPNGLKELAEMLNKLTGALSSDASGISRFMQSVERGALFFSPRYTRSSISLLSDFMSGGMKGRVARESLLGMLGVGVGAHWLFTQAINAAGGKQELNLDPTKSTFLTVNIGDDNIGVGGFWAQFAKLVSRLAETSWDEEARQEFLGDEAVRKNPIIRYIRSRSAPSFGVGWDIAVGEDFLGRKLESIPDWTRHLGEQAMPIWLESAVIADPYKTGLLGVAGEIAGGRIRPLSAMERRRDLRNKMAVDIYGKEWTDLNGLQRTKIDEGTHPDVLPRDHTDLGELTALVREQRGDKGDDVDLNIEMFHSESVKIENKWINNVKVGLTHLDTDTIDLEQFRNLYLSPANAIRRRAVEDLNDPEGRYSQAITHFNEQRERYGESDPEDVAYNEFITSVISTNEFEQPWGFDFEAKDEKVAGFRQVWGDDVYAYVQQRFREGRGIPALVSEFWRGREVFMSMYHRDVTEAVLESVPRSEYLRLQYSNWKKSTGNQQREIEETVPGFKSMMRTMDKVRIELRKQNKFLDAWLFRWGYTSTLIHHENEFAPDGLSDPREYWRDSNVRGLEDFGISDNPDTVLIS
jgi:hypothetical protein